MRYLGMITVAVFCGCGSVQSQQATPKPKVGRFLYMLGCLADLTKSDSVTGHVLGDTNLARLTKLIPTRGGTAESVVDGCSTYGLAYDQSHKLLYTVSPTTGDYDGRLFRLLSFQLPSLKVSAAIRLNIRDHLAEPRVENDTSGAVLIRSSGKTMRLEGGRLVRTIIKQAPPSPGSTPDKVGKPTFWSLALQNYKTTNLDLGINEKRFSYRPLERSGGSLLLSYFLPSGDTGFAILDVQNGIIVRLAPPFKVTQGSLHLAPGGHFVVAQESRYLAGAGLEQTGSRFALLDSTSGLVQKAWSQADLAKHLFLTLTPAGAMVTLYGSEVRFVPVGQSFNQEPVVTLGDPPNVPFIYADE